MIFNDNSVICKSCVLFCIEVYIVLQRLYGVTSNPNDCDFLLQVFGIIFTICQGKIMDSLILWLESLPVCLPADRNHHYRCRSFYTHLPEYLFLFNQV